MQKFDEVFDFHNLFKAGQKSCKGVRWKSSTILFETFLAREVVKIQKELKDPKRKFKGFHSFKLVEHGKERLIDALPIRDRTAQKCFVENAMRGAYEKSFVTDNSASLKNRGMDFALNRMKKHLRDHFRRYGLEGGIFQFDFKSYFESIPHGGMKQRAKDKIKGPELLKVFNMWVDDFQKLQWAKPNIKRGAGLGSEISQLISLDYASPIDHFIKDVYGIKGYGRYMDDGYVISNSIEELEKIKTEVYRIAQNLGLTMSEKKCKITPFKHHSFRFLKMRFKITNTGKVIMRLDGKSTTRIKRKLHIFKKWLDEGKMNFEDIRASYMSWRSHAKRAKSYRTLQSVDTLFNKLYKGA